MPPKKNAKAKTNNGNGATLGIENELWEAADKLRGHLDAAEYKAEFAQDGIEHGLVQMKGLI